MTKKELRELQLNLLETLKYVDKFCRKHNITYYLIYGSCIGAVRHKGFIPWDDDLDIAMCKDDYDKFCELFSKEDTGKYFLQTRKTDKNYYLDFAKIRNTNTTLIETKNKDDMNIVLGTYIDIFPLVGVPNNKILKKIQKINRALYFNTEKNMINNKCLRIIANTIIKIVGKNTIRNICYKNITKYSCEKSPYWFSCFDAMYEENIHPKEYYSEPTYVDFENFQVPIPKEYDKILSKIYGNYMKPPKKTDRKSNHSIYILDLKKSYKEYINK